MGWEIERRYLVLVSEGAWDDVPEGRPLRQGYVKNGSPSVRIREGEARGFVLTCKSGKGIRRREVETVVPGEVAEALFEAAEERVVEKVRHVVGPWELDRFQGDLEGLTLLEIELDDEEDIVPNPPPGVHIIREVTDDKEFVSGRLARLDEKERRRFVRKVYGEAEEWNGAKD